MDGELSAEIESQPIMAGAGRSSGHKPTTLKAVDLTSADLLCIRHLARLGSSR